MRLAGRLFARGPVIALFVAASAFGVSGCGAGSSGDGGGEGSGDGGAGQNNGTLTVFAAASLTDAFGELAEDFEQQNPGVEVRTNFASSATLATQIQQGAPADVYASADEAQMDDVAEAGLVSGEPETFVNNREVVTVPDENPAGIEEFGDLSQEGIRLVLAADEVPAAEYAFDILQNAADDPEYGPEFEQAVTSNIVSREEDVRAAVNRVMVGDADATFGYASDITPDVREEVEVVEIPEDLNVIATYPIAVLEGAEDEGLAREWVEFILSGEGQQVLEEWGFTPVVR